MERRNFLRSILGVAAATALPSEVWPFRKIFLPAAPQIIWPSEISPIGFFHNVELTYLTQMSALWCNRPNARLTNIEIPQWEEIDANIVTVKII